MENGNRFLINKNDIQSHRSVPLYLLRRTTAFEGAANEGNGGNGWVYGSNCGKDQCVRSRSDWLSKQGARALAKLLEAYWHGERYPAARFWAEPVDERFSKIGTYEIYRIACDLINGLPPTHR
ncbi:hypothetical protein [Bradyrhizobium sp. BWC-3-1]|uniref:hypothetical protein n=1 Tax=Bradyrhizobium sp. BWC-3-1 TaxID=3080012 RepID=UPI00293E286E|nr:hypothetical protein [Bradyrhizobium sp. BWC-3-1]WOH59915.1 hypothetical protein RX329_07260 [Bradyrhizobium sp. BWC-3-1]